MTHLIIGVAVFALGVGFAFGMAARAANAADELAASAEVIRQLTQRNSFLSERCGQLTHENELLQHQNRGYRLLLMVKDKPLPFKAVSPN